MLRSVEYCIDLINISAVRGWRTRANFRRRSACRARRATQCQLRGPACACAPGADLRGPKCSTRSKKARTRCGLRCPKSKMSTSSTNTPASYFPSRFSYSIWVIGFSTFSNLSSVGNVSKTLQSECRY